MPGVVATYPNRGTIYVSTEPTIYVAFNQPMDRASVEAAFTLRQGVAGGTVEGTFEWHDAGLILPDRQAYEPYAWSWSAGAGPERVGVETMGFTPSEPLAFNTTYVAGVAAGAKGAAGGAMPSSHKSSFTTIEYPYIVTTNPSDGEQDIRPGSGLNIIFSSPMDPASLEDNFAISPDVDATDVYTYWWNSNTELQLSFDVKPNTDYAVTISGNLKGRYGHALGTDTTIRWSTSSLSPIAYLHTRGRVTTYNAYTQTVAYVSVRNVGQVNLSLYKMPVSDFLSAYDSWNYWDRYQGRSENLVRSWSVDTKAPLDDRVIYGSRLSETEDGRLEPGIYYLETSVPSGAVYPEVGTYHPPEPGKHILVVSRYNLTVKKGTEGVLVWATDLNSGDVVPDLPIAVRRKTGSRTDGTTDKDGVFFAADFSTPDRWTSVFAFAGDAETPGENFAVATNDWSGGISAWDFDLPMAYDEPYTAYFFTDRPIYRPDQTVHFKGILRHDEDAHYSMLPENAEIQVTIWDSQGTEVYQETLPVSEMGTAFGEISLSEEAALGDYHIEGVYKDVYFGTSFQVAEYRKPEFQVEVTTDAAEYVQGDTFEVTAEATYFFGGAVADAEVQYYVLSNDHYFYYKDGGWWDLTDSDYQSWWYWYDRRSSYGELIDEGTGTTDENGRFNFTVDADIAEKIASQRFTLEVTVVDINDQAVSSRVDAIVHKGQYYIGLKPDWYVGVAGKDTAVNIITVDWDSEPVPDRELTVVFYKHDWYSVRKQG